MASIAVREKTKAESPAMQVARNYVDQQLAIMKKFGSAPTLTRKDYDELVQKVILATR